MKALLVIVVQCALFELASSQDFKMRDSNDFRTTMHCYLDSFKIISPKIYQNINAISIATDLEGNLKKFEIILKDSTSKLSSFEYGPILAKV